MNAKPDTMSSKEWQRQQPMEWRMKIAKLCHNSQITAEHLDDNAEVWAALKDAGQCRLVYQGDYVEGIGAFNGGYYIEYGGIVNDPVFVSGDTLIQIEWLS